MRRSVAARRSRRLPLITRSRPIQVSQLEEAEMLRAPSELLGRRQEQANAKGGCTGKEEELCSADFGPSPDGAGVGLKKKSSAAVIAVNCASWVDHDHLRSAITRQCSCWGLPDPALLPAHTDA